MARLEGRQATGSGLHRAKEWLDGPDAVHRMNCGKRPSFLIPQFTVKEWLLNEKQDDFWALLVSAALCSQGFGFELLDRMLGLNNGGCGGCNCLRQCRLL